MIPCRERWFTLSVCLCVSGLCGNSAGCKTHLAFYLCCEIVFYAGETLLYAVVYSIAKLFFFLNNIYLSERFCVEGEMNPNCK